MKIKREYEYARKINGAAMDMNISEVDVTLSLSHAVAGEGILSEISISGLTGMLDRRTTIWTEAMEAAHQKREATENDFHLNYVKIKDLALTIHQKCPDRPLDLTIFSLKLRRLRQHWLLLDLFDADAGHGKFDDCLFSIENVEVDYKNQIRTVSDIGSISI
ncbi:MAG: mitochondrial distribution and morphology protein [Cytophagales bacterium]|nr:mitochondrial distribution and morphology protein [Cytophagales bacterium]